MTTRLRRDSPADLRTDPGPDARRALPGADYADAFRVPCMAFHSAEDWARAAFEQVPTSSTLSAQLVWRGVLNLRLGPLRDPGRVAGWEVAENRPERLVLRARSWHLAAALVFAATEHDAGVTTLLEYRRPVGRTLWATVGAVHRRAVPGILLAARQRLEPGLDGARG